jgi:phage-related minor tail protein
VQLEAAHASTIAVDAAEQGAAKNTIKSYDDLLLKTGNLRDGLQAFFNQIALDAKTPAQQIFDAFTTAYQGVQDSLTKLVTGQKGALPIAPAAFVVRV